MTLGIRYSKLAGLYQVGPVGLLVVLSRRLTNLTHGFRPRLRGLLNHSLIH